MTMILTGEMEDEGARWVGYFFSYLRVGEVIYGFVGEVEEDFRGEIISG